MKSSTLPDGLPVLSRGHHRSPRRGACFMELASVLAGERWSDSPRCTHPALAELAREVNDHISDAGRQQLLPLVPSVVGRRGDDHTAVAVAVAVAATAMLDVPESTQRVLAVGLLRAERLCASAGRELAATRVQALYALAKVPGAVRWAERLELPYRPADAGRFAKSSAPAIIRRAVEGVAATGSPDCDARLRSLLEAGLAACPAPEPLESLPVRQNAARWQPRPDEPSVR